MLNGKHIRYLTDVFGNVCGGFGATLVEHTGEDDCVHLLAEYPSKVPAPRW